MHLVVFVSGIAGLSRIVTLHDFTISSSENPQKKSEIPSINYVLQAKTYRYVGNSDSTPTEGAQ